LGLGVGRWILGGGGGKKKFAKISVWPFVTPRQLLNKGGLYCSTRPTESKTVFVDFSNENALFFGHFCRLIQPLSFAHFNSCIDQLDGYKHGWRIHALLTNQLAQ